MRLSGCLLAVLLAVFALAPCLAQAGNAKAELKQVKKQRVELAAVRKELEARMGTLGVELKQVDSALVDADAQVRKASKDVRDADARIAALRDKQAVLQARIGQLKSQMQQEAALAYRRSGGASLWMDMMFNAKVADIPHRQYLLSRLVQRQQQDRVEYAQARKALAATEHDLQKQRKALVGLRQTKLERQHALQAARDDKRKLLRKVRRDVGLKKQRDAQLARQEAALKKLLAGVGSTLLNTDNIDNWKAMRAQKGHLPWPLRGRIVAGFHSPTTSGRPSLAGVQLAPLHGDRQVRAIASGQVRYADWFGGYGLMMIVDHGDGLVTVYAHNNALYKQAGDWVSEGDVLADAGSTGWVQTTRLYFEVRDRGRPSNPRRWCRKQG